MSEFSIYKTGIIILPSFIKCFELCHGKVLCQKQSYYAGPLASVFSEGGFTLGKDTYVVAPSSVGQLLDVPVHVHSIAEESWSRRLADQSVI